ncbi:MAG: glycoside hydrolase family 9 protein [Nibricoccus sp.]
MRPIFWLLFPCFALIAHAGEKPLKLAPGASIRVNSIGFVPSSKKQATVLPGAKTFRVLRLETTDEREIFSGVASEPTQSAPTDTNETLRTLDFSSITTPGRYIIDIPGLGRSTPFTIGDDVWNRPFRTVTHAMYLWRCGTDVKGEHNGVTYHQHACHLEDGWLDHVGGGHNRRASAGGWHDAGDYNKYVVNAGVTVGLMLKALEHFPARIAAVNLGIPESANTTPDLLDEIRWELEWLFTMQLEDGRVYHKVSSPDFRYWGAPDADKAPRYFAPWGTNATAHFTAMMAGAARHFRAYDEAFADRCLKAAELSWSCLRKHPTQIDPDQSFFKTGGYDTPDQSARLWAAAELWETTGNVDYLREFETRAASVEFSENGPGWGDVNDLALGMYLLFRHTTPSNDPRNAALVRRLADNLFKRADTIIATAAGNPHGRPLGVERKHWSWGCNGNVASQTIQLHLANRLRPDPRYRETAQLALGHLFGRNYHGRSYVTGLGANPPQHPHDRRGEPAWPGYLVGGAWPDGRGWVDELASYERNEIAINWNAALIYALAAFVEPEKR